jgi:PAS domain S-box-containing protein
MRQAKEFMTPNPICLSETHEFREAMKIFLENNIHSCPVRDHSGKVLGILTELDLVKGILRHHVELNRHARIMDHLDLLEKAISVSEDATVTVVIQSIVKATAHRVVVVDKSQRIIGIISPKDVLKIVMGETLNSPSLQDQLREAREKIEMLTRHVTDLSKDRAQYEKLFLESPYMIHSADWEGKIVMANKKIHDVLGYSPRELIGKTIFDIYPPTLHKEARLGLQSIMDSGYHRLTYSTMLKKDGEPVRVDLASSAVKSDSGSFLSTITISRLVDSDALLRALHGVVKDMSKPQ